MNDSFMEPIVDIELDCNANTTKAGDESSTKQTYKDRKLEHKLKKYETMLKKEGVNRVSESQFLFVGNCGLNNNISCSLLESTFEQHGKIIDIVMPKAKSYSFVIFQNSHSTSKAIQELQAQVITTNQTPICFYLFPVDKVTEVSGDQSEVVNFLPDGLVYLENFVDESYGQELAEFFTISDSPVFDLKKRTVKQYGYEFRYGTNDCDETKPLLEQKIPQVVDRVIKRMLDEKIIELEPDQLTVNFYEPGQGIAPHVDNPDSFEDYIISLSLVSSVIMEFRKRNESSKSNKLAKLHLQPNSLLVLKGESRYLWTHGISERKHDIVPNNNLSYLVLERARRISLTFRKLKISTKTVSDKRPTNELNLPTSENEALQFENSFVHTVYNQIADHFSSTRHTAWPGVVKFIQSLEPFSLLLDIGCGNGKYLNLRPKDLFAFGSDYSVELVKICNERGFNCFVSDCLKVPAKDDSFDYLICIAVIHHLSTTERRVKALNEMIRIMRPGGRALVTVWAKEQKYKNKDSFYISKKTSTEADATTTSTTSDESSMVHNFGNEFQKKDLFVSWRYKGNSDAVFLRYYHVFEENELESLFDSVPEARIVESYYEQGNWCAIFEKIVK